MIAALEALNSNARLVDDQSSKAFASMKISSGEPKGLMALLMTHPPLTARIQRLKSFT
jgi:Zn-dependent protease with chaperone function